MKQHNNIEYSKGFTLIELLVVVAVLGILAGGILIALNIGGVLGKANLTKAKKFAAQLERGLVISQVGKWSFEDADTSDSAADTSGYGINGNLGGTTLPSCTSANPGGSCPKKLTASACELGLGKCLSFDGTNDYVEIPNSPSTNFGTGDFTLSAWINTTTTASSKSIIETGAGFAIKSLRINDPSTGYLAFYAGGCSSEVNVKINDGSWHHVVGVRKGLNIRLYKDGVLIPPEACDAGDTNTFAPWLVAKNALGATTYTSGLIDEVQIYNEALNLSQIRKLYAQGVIRRALAFR